MRVLLVEDDRDLASRIAEHLRGEHFAVDVAANGEDGQHQGETERYDVAVLDLGLPKVPGIDVLRAWRAAGRAMPVLILTARDGWGRPTRPLLRQGFYLRSHWLRMPPAMLARHLWTKWRKGHRPT